MQEWMDAGARVLLAALAGAGLVALAMLTSDVLPPTGEPDALGGWPLLMALAALLCGVCALGMSVGLRWSIARAVWLVRVWLVVGALAWGACLSAAVSSAGWAHALAGAPWLAHVVAPLAAAGATVVAWLLLFAALTGALAGMRRAASATRRALTPLWGASVGLVYGLLVASIYAPRPSGVHFYELDPGRWEGLRAGLTLGVTAGLILGLILALALRMALIVRPAPADHSSRMVRLGAHRLEA